MELSEGWYLGWYFRAGAEGNNEGLARGESFCPSWSVEIPAWISN